MKETVSKRRSCIRGVIAKPESLRSSLRRHCSWAVRGPSSSSFRSPPVQGNRNPAEDNARRPETVRCVDPRRGSSRRRLTVFHATMGSGENTHETGVAADGARPQCASAEDRGARRRAPTVAFAAVWRRQQNGCCADGAAHGSIPIMVAAAEPGSASAASRYQHEECGTCQCIGASSAATVAERRPAVWLGRDSSKLEPGRYCIQGAHACRC